MVRSSFPRRRLIAGALGLVLTAAAGGGTLFLTSGPAGARSGSGATGDGTVIVCESGTVSHGGVDTSSAVAVRVPAGTPVPPGCREG
jgi:hypothetical protein